MSRRLVRYELLLYATLGFETVYLSLLSFSLARSPGGGGLGWLPLFLFGSAMLFWNRILVWRGLWDRGSGRVVSLVGAFVLLSFLLPLAAPAATGPVAGPGTWFAALGGIFRLFSGTAPLTVGLVIGLALWFRSVLIAQSDATLEATFARFRWSTLLVIVLLVEAAGRGSFPSSALVFIFFGFGLLAMTLARADHSTQATEVGLLTVPFNARWLTAAIGSVAGVLVVGSAATTVFSFRGAELLYDLSAPLRYALGVIFALYIYLLSRIMLPALEYVFENVEPLEMEATPGPVPTPQPGQPIEGAGEFLLEAILFGALFFFVAIAVWYFYRLLTQKQRQRAGMEAELLAEYGQTEAEWDATSWWRPLLGRSRPRRRASFGVETVRDLYKNLLLFGDEHGLPRPQEDTPYEYLVPLCEQYPKRRDDFYELTEAYIAAHYGEKEFPSEEVHRLQRAWARIAREPVLPRGSSDEDEQD